MVLQVSQKAAERYLALLISRCALQAFDKRPRKISLLLLFVFVRATAYVCRIERGKCFYLRVAFVKVEMLSEPVGELVISIAAAG